MIQKTVMAALFGMVATSASAQLVPVSAQVDRTGNGVLDLGETVTVEPSWRNMGPLSVVADPTVLFELHGPSACHVYAGRHDRRLRPIRGRRDAAMLQLLLGPGYGRAQAGDAL